ncbi:protein hapless 2 [Anaeramoeba ignava]|uniref:Protein hapless 2 n=1 Tax=Anaeramoeba ignava TaxID=1746090 RepID=A0A9Q0LE43_ANAIG|nr:protein hapless 2 [Anaeramoeba ignava]
MNFQVFLFLFFLLFLFNLKIILSSCPFLSKTYPDSGTEQIAGFTFELIVEFSETISIQNEMEEKIPLRNLSDVDLSYWFFTNSRTYAYTTLYPIFLLNTQSNQVISPVTVNQIDTIGDSFQVTFPILNDNQDTLVLYVLDNLFFSENYPQNSVQFQAKSWFYTGTNPTKPCENFTVLNPIKEFCSNSSTEHYSPESQIVWEQQISNFTLNFPTISSCTQFDKISCMYKLMLRIYVSNPGNYSNLSLKNISITYQDIQYKISSDLSINILKKDTLAKIPIQSFNESIHNSKETYIAGPDPIYFVERKTQWANQQEFITYFEKWKRGELVLSSDPNLNGSETLEMIENLDQFICSFFDLNVSTTESIIDFHWNKSSYIWQKQTIESSGFVCDSCSFRDYNSFYADWTRHILEIDQDNPWRIFRFNTLSQMNQEIQIDNGISVFLFENTNQSIVDILNISKERADNSYLSENSTSEIKINFGFDTFDKLFSSSEQNYVLLVPDLPEVLTENGPLSPQITTNITGFENWLTVLNTLIGSECGLLGISYESFYNQETKCEVPYGTCVEQQIEDLQKNELGKLGDFLPLFSSRLNATLKSSFSDLDSIRDRISIDNSTYNLLLEYSQQEILNMDLYLNLDLISFHQPFIVLSDHEWDVLSEEEKQQAICSQIDFQPNSTVFNEDKGRLFVSTSNGGTEPGDFSVSVSCEFEYDPHFNQISGLLPSQSVEFEFDLEIQNQTWNLTSQINKSCVVSFNSNKKLLWDTKGKNFACIKNLTLFFGRFIPACELERNETYVKQNIPEMPYLLLNSQGNINVSFGFERNERNIGELEVMITNTGVVSGKFEVKMVCENTSSISPKLESQEIEVGSLSSSNTTIEMKFDDFPQEVIFLDNVYYSYSCNLSIEALTPARECWSSLNKSAADSVVFIVQNGLFMNDVVIENQWNNSNTSVSITSSPANSKFFLFLSKVYGWNNKWVLLLFFFLSILSVPFVIFLIIFCVKKAKREVKDLSITLSDWIQIQNLNKTIQEKKKSKTQKKQTNSFLWIGENEIHEETLINLRNRKKKKVDQNSLDEVTFNYHKKKSKEDQQEQEEESVRILHNFWIGLGYKSFVFLDNPEIWKKCVVHGDLFLPEKNSFENSNQITVEFEGFDDVEVEIDWDNNPQDDSDVIVKLVRKEFVQDSLENVKKLKIIRYFLLTPSKLYHQFWDVFIHNVKKNVSDDIISQFTFGKTGYSFSQEDNLLNEKNPIQKNSIFDFDSNSNPNQISDFSTSEISDEDYLDSDDLFLDNQRSFSLLENSNDKSFNQDFGKENFEMSDSLEIEYEEK